MPFLSIDFKSIPVLGLAIGWMEDNNLDYGLPVAFVIGILLYIAFTTSPFLMPSAFAFFLALAPIWFPFMALEIFHFRWLDYVQKKYYLSSRRKLYRIKLPQEVFKSPRAMEYVLSQAWSTQTPDNFYESYVQGKAPLPTGLEIVSIGGEVRFYINIFEKKGAEALVPALYAHYPGIEVAEEPVDYTGEIEWQNDPEWEKWFTHINKKQSDDKWGPIRTYIEFGLDDNPKEEEKIDPLNTILEQMAAMGPNERLYVQYIITAIAKPSLVRGNLKLFEGPNWTNFAERRVDEILRRDPKTKGPIQSEGGTDFDGVPRVSPGERDDCECIERNMEKYAYRVAIRFCYFAKKGHFRPNLINAFNRMFTQFDKVGRAALGQRWRTDFNYMWFSDPFGDRLRSHKQVEHKLTKLRKFAPQAQSDDMKVFTTEELATMFHIPGKVATTPTLERIPSLRSQAPSNLPIGEPPTY
ncbi:hypothetical protein N9L26_01770 [Candidatus Pacebacteria bacterium]|nr:hypothetical protein [Candidatus Paceibacterota bacterium]